MKYLLILSVVTFILFSVGCSSEFSKVLEEVKHKNMALIAGNGDIANLEKHLQVLDDLLFRAEARNKSSMDEKLVNYLDSYFRRAIFFNEFEINLDPEEFLSKKSKIAISDLFEYRDFPEPSSITINDSFNIQAELDLIADRVGDKTLTPSISREIDRVLYLNRVDLYQLYAKGHDFNSYFSSSYFFYQKLRKTLLDFGIRI